MTPESTPTAVEKSSGAFRAFLIGLAILVLAMIYPYLGVVVFSLVMVFILKPLYDRLLRRFKGRSGLAVTVTLLVSALIPIAIFGFAGSMLVSQLTELAGAPATTASTSETANQLNELLMTLTKSGFSTGQSANPQMLKAMAQLAGGLVGLIAKLGFSVLSLLLNLVIFITIVAPLLTNYDTFTNWLKKLSPFPEEVDQLFINRTRDMVIAMFLSIFVIAFAQCLVMGVFFWIAGVKPVIFWIFLSFASSLLPFGNFISAFPLGIFLIATGKTGGGLILIFGYLLIVSNMDTIMRPKLIPRGVSLTYALALLASLGGLSFFGYLGVIYGPVIMVTFVTALEVYLRNYTAEKPILLPDKTMESP